MRNPREAFKEASTNLENLGKVADVGLPIAAEMVVRLVVAVRSVLDRHHPTHRAAGWFCWFCGNPYPCRDAAAVLAALGVPIEDDDLDDGKDHR